MRIPEKLEGAPAKSIPSLMKSMWEMVCTKFAAMKSKLQKIISEKKVL